MMAQQGMDYNCICGLLVAWEASAHVQSALLVGACCFLPASGQQCQLLFIIIIIAQFITCQEGEADAHQQC